MAIAENAKRAVGTHTCPNCGEENTGFMRALEGQLICPACAQVF